MPHQCGEHYPQPQLIPAAAFLVYEGIAQSGAIVKPMREEELDAK
jgi:hypothetical protein